MRINIKFLPIILALSLSACMTAQKTSDLFDAIDRGNLAAASDAINNGADVNATPDYALGDTPLMSAVTKNEIEIIKLLISKGADITARNKNGDTALMLEARFGKEANLKQRIAKEEILKILISKGADINAKNKNGETALLQASFDLGSDITVGKIETVRMLISMGADLNAQNTNGITPLMASILRAHREIAGILIEKGADVNIRDANGDTALSSAIVMGYKDIVKLLISKGADVNAKNKDGTTPLMIASENERNDEAMIELLLSNGADINAEDRKGDTAVNYARKNRRAKIIELLKKAGGV